MSILPPNGFKPTPNPNSNDNHGSDNISLIHPLSECTHYNQNYNPNNGGCLHRVRSVAYHPIRTIFNNPNRKTYVIDNKTNKNLIISVSHDAFKNLGKEEKFLRVGQFDTKYISVNTAGERHQFLRVHSEPNKLGDNESKVIIASKFLNPIFTHISIIEDYNCGIKLELQVSPLI